MNKEEYIKKNVVLEGYGAIREIALNAEWFAEQEKHLGEIEDIIEIEKSSGGIGGFFGSGHLEGCFVIFKSGAIMCFESDGEYVDMFCGRKEVKK